MKECFHKRQKDVRCLPRWTSSQPPFPQQWHCDSGKFTLQGPLLSENELKKKYTGFGRTRQNLRPGYVVRPAGPPSKAHVKRTPSLCRMNLAPTVGIGWFPEASKLTLMGKTSSTFSRVALHSYRPAPLAASIVRAHFTPKGEVLSFYASVKTAFLHQDLALKKGRQLILTRSTQAMV